MKIFYLKRPRKGFSLIEVLIASAISLMATTAVLSIFIAASRMSVEAFFQNQATMQARSVIDTLTRDVRSAVEVETSYGAFNANSSTLILKLPAIDNNGFPTNVDSNFDRIIYHRDDQERMIRQVVAHGSSSRESGSRVIGSQARGVVQLAGTYDVLPDAIGAYVIYYKFTAVQSRGEKVFNVPLAGSVRLRNKTPVATGGSS